MAEQNASEDAARRMGPSWALYAGLALTTCSMLLAQQFLTRVFSILFNSGLAFLAISITFLGLGSAGVAVYVLPRAFEARRSARLVPWLALGYAVALVGGIAAVVALDHSAGAHEGALKGQIVRVVGSSLLVLPAMVLV